MGERFEEAEEAIDEAAASSAQQPDELDFLGEPKEPEPTDKVSSLTDRRRKLLIELRESLPKKNDEFHRLWIDLFGVRGDDSQIGLQGMIDSQFELPHIGEMRVARWWDQYKRQLKSLVLNYNEQVNNLKVYLKQFNDLAKESLQLVVEYEKVCVELQARTQSHRLTEEQKAKYADEVERRVVRSVGQARERELVLIYDELTSNDQYVALLRPNGPLKPPERIFLRMVNQYKQKFLQEIRTEPAQENI